MKKRLVTLLVAAVVLSTSLTCCTIGNTEFVLDTNFVGRGQVFSINGTKCTNEEARLYLCNYQNLYGNEYGLNLWEYDFSETDVKVTLEDYVKEIALSELTNVTVLYLLAEQQEVSLTEEELLLVDAATEEYYGTLTKDELSYIGMNKSELKACYEKYATAQKMYKMLTEGVNEEVSIDEARVMHIQQIFLTSEAKAKIAAQQLAAGEDFASVAGDYNEAETVETTLSRDSYPDEVEEVAFHLEDGEQSDMIETAEGYYFIKCVNKYDKELTEENKENIRIKRREEQFDSLLHDFIYNSDFELKEKVWEEIKLDTSGAITTDSFFQVYETHFNETAETEEE